MIGHELAVEQREATRLHPRHQPGQPYLRCVGTARDHAFTKKGAAQRDAIKPADKLLPFPAFDRMRKAQVVQGAIGRFYLTVDPGRGTIGRSRGAKRDDIAESAVGGNAKPIGPDHLCQRARQMETIERQDRPLARLHPIDVLRLAIVGHGKDADRIGLKQQYGVQGHYDDGLTEPTRRTRAALHYATALGPSTRRCPLALPEAPRYSALLRRHRSVAQLVERRSPKPNVLGSNPGTPAIGLCVATHMSMGWPRFSVAGWRSHPGRREWRGPDGGLYPATCCCF